ncbi:MAG: (d)CMP kinase [Alphaproteobacteria bacterium]
MHKSFVIAIDGTAASGKGTLAKRLAKHFNYAHLDTGKIYRALAYRVIQTNTDPSNTNAVVDLIGSISDIKFDNPELVSNEVGKMASIVSPIPQVRENLLDYQRKFPTVSLEKNFDGVVVDGRDIGSVIFPDADVKFFVDADVEVRAKRRFDELIARGDNVEFETILNDIKVRDTADKNRATSPLIKCDDAHSVDTTNVDIDTMVQNAIDIIAK